MLQTLVALGGAAPWPWQAIARSQEPATPPQATAQLMAELAQSLPPLSGEHTAWVKRFTHFHHPRVAQDMGHIERFCTPDGLILDVGAAPFMLSIGLSRAGHAVRALDLHPDRLADIIKTHGLQVDRCDVEQDRWPVDDGTVQTIAFFEVFEHLRLDLNRTMSELRRVLSPTGRALISTPNLRSLAGLFNLVHKGRSYSCLGDIHAEWNKLQTLGHMGHVREYTAWDLVPYFEALGLTVEEIIFRGRFGVADMDAIIDEHPHLSPFFTLVVAHQT
jgi:SAM-dependent methyltransferase